MTYKPSSTIHLIYLHHSRSCTIHLTSYTLHHTQEISIMKMVKHKNIVGMVEVLASKTKIFIVLELVTGGELFDKVWRVLFVMSGA
ncbi:hypothetical protein EON63_08605 [archaeon]|nr:MAG: hypothetical protein EON63_08605 [archaeon]